MTIVNLLKMLVSDQGSVAAADDNVKNGGSLYGDNNDVDNDDKE